MGTLLLKHCGGCLLLAALAAPAGATEDTDTPGAGRWEINIGAAGHRASGEWELTAPDMELNYGVGDRLQLLLGIPYVHVRESGQPAKSGFGAATAGVKWRLLDQERSGWSLAWFPQFSWNPSSSASARGLASPGRSLLLPLVAGVRSGDTGWYAEVGRNVVEHGEDEWQAGLKVLHQCLPRLECRVEVEHSRVPRDGSQTLLSSGGKWSLSEGLVLEGSIGRDISGGQEGRRSLVFYLGLQLLR